MRKSALTVPWRPSSNLTWVAMNCDALPLVQRVDQHRVFFGDELAAHLAGAGQLVVVRVELLVQHQEAVDLRVAHQRFAGQVGVDLFDALAHQLIRLRMGGQVGVAGVGDVAPLGPVADRFHVDVDEGADAVAAIAEGDRLFNERGRT
jgi:hypothetical protein